MSEDMEVELAAAQSITIEKADNGYVVVYSRQQKGASYYSKSYKKLASNFNLAIAIGQMALTTEDTALKSEVR